MAVLGMVVKLAYARSDVKTIYWEAYAAHRKANEDRYDDDIEAIFAANDAGRAAVRAYYERYERLEADLASYHATLASYSEPKHEPHDWQRDGF